MTDQASDDPRIGTRIDDYHVTALLGVGGMGKVYEATDPAGTKVALKLVKEDYARDETFRRRFNREARIAQTVAHRNVVPVLATGVHDGVPYMAQKYVEGLALDRKLKQERRLDVPTAVRICSDAAGGLDALWAEGIVHRDLKPANILLDRDGTAYVTDFGLSKDIQGSLLTLPGQAVGSMDYMAPEQIRGEPVSAATDIYALGCVMFECLCGWPPFADVQGMRVLWAHLHDDPPDPLSVQADLPPELARTMLLALEKEPEKRPASAAEYARLLAVAA